MIIEKIDNGVLAVSIDHNSYLTDFKKELALLKARLAQRGHSTAGVIEVLVAVKHYTEVEGHDKALMVQRITRAINESWLRSRCLAPAVEVEFRSLEVQI